MLVYRTEHNLLLICQQSSSDTIGDTAWLVINLFEHEMFITSLLKSIEIYVHFLDLRVYILIVKCMDLHFLSYLQQSHLSIIQIYHLLGVFHDRQSV